jgi:putative ABC transport system substrate-binding protein
MLMTFAEHEIERSVEAFARSPNGGLVVTQSASATVYRDVIIAAARYKLPAVYALRYDATGGGLISYRPNIVDQFRQAAA